MISFLAYILAWTLGHSQRWKVIDPHGVSKADTSQRFIFAFWHNRLMVMPLVYQRELKKRKAVAIVSASKDGALLASALERFGLLAVRGSTSRFGTQALRELTHKIKEGFDAAITPDGPRGPRYKAQQGVVALAQLAGVPIVPISCRLSFKIQLNSWDRFQVPLPFGRCEIHFGKPITVPSTADETVRAQKLRELEETLQELGGDPVQSTLSPRDKE